MSAREWKPVPGDVALVHNQFGVWNVAICTVALDGFLWRYGVALDEEPVKGSEARPLLVIDPEDREQVGKVLDALKVARDADPLRVVNDDTVQAALRSLLTPPKPPEPQGLGAVVRERHPEDGVDWVRVPLASNDERWFCGDTGEWRTYADIDVVRVLSEGVQP